MKTISKGPFLGVNNRLPDFALHKPKVGDFLRQAENVDITNSGNIKRRKATALVQALMNPHSLHMDSPNTGYLVASSNMYRIGAMTPTYSQSHFKTLSVDDPVSFLPYAGSLYWSNGTDSGRIEGGLNFPMALPTPATPAVTNIAGTLDAGWYQVTLAHYNNVTGEEGGVAPSQNYHLTAAGALRVTLPSAVTGGTYVNVYVSMADGSIPMLQTSVAAGTSTVDITAISTTGREAVQRFEAPLPAGTLFLHNGALCSFNGNNVYRGIPYRPGYHIPSESRIPFPAAVTNAISAQHGVYVTADQTYWLPGVDLKDVGTIVDVLPYGGVRGTGFKVPFNSKVGWFGDMGIVIADLQGQVEAVMADNIDLPALPASGTAYVTSEGGFYRVTSCGWTVNLENLAATSYTDYDFTSVSGRYGTKATGVFDLVATGEVAYTIGLGKENFGAEQFKHLPAMYLGVDSEVPITLRVQAPGGLDYSYDARSSGADTRIQRIDPGKGLRANWFDLSLSGTYDFLLASASFAPTVSARRI